MLYNGITPENILPEEANSIEINGVSVRKGTVGAILANIELLEAETVSADDKEAAINAIKDLAPAVLALGLNKHVVWKNPMVQSMIDEAKQLNQYIN